MLSVANQSIILSFVMLNVVMLNVVMLNVVAPFLGSYILPFQGNITIHFCFNVVSKAAVIILPKMVVNN
jgi:hypothetical protein